MKRGNDLPRTPLRFLLVDATAMGAAAGALQAGCSVVGCCDVDEERRRLFAENFPATQAGVPDDLASVPRADVFWIGNVRSSWARDVADLVGPRCIVFEKKAEWTPQGYSAWEETMCSSEFGLPQKRPRKFVVCFREDINPGFRRFPFPDPVPLRSTVGDLLGKHPELVLSNDRIERLRRADERRQAGGFRFKRRRISQDGLLPTLSSGLAKDRTSILVEAVEGARPLSLEEAREAMGLPSWQLLPGRVEDAWRALGADVCPPVAKALMEEIDVWLF